MIALLLSDEIPRGRKVGYIGTILMGFSLAMAITPQRADPARLLLPWVLPVGTSGLALLLFGICWRLMSRLAFARVPVFGVILPLASFAALYPAFLASSLASVVADGFVPTLGAQMAFSAPIVLLVGLLVQWLEYRERRAGPASAEHGASRLAPDSGLPTRKP
jgi:hypothetical protein